MTRRTRKKKSGFLTFCFSFLPGAGEMYLGFMKMGISLMGLFFVSLALAIILNMPTILFIMVVEWFYSFFHVHNLAGLTDEEFLDTKDEFLFNLDTFFNLDEKSVEKYRKMIAIILIILGVLLLWNGIKDAFFVYLPDMVWRFVSRMERTLPEIFVGIAIIVGGFHMIKGRKEELKEVIVDVESTVKDADSSEEAGSGYNENAAADIIYGTDTMVSDVPERSSYGTGEKH